MIRSFLIISIVIQIAVGGQEEVDCRQVVQQRELEIQSKLNSALGEITNLRNALKNAEQAALKAEEAGQLAKREKETSLKVESANVARAIAEAEAAELKFKELQKHHLNAVFPHWLEESLNKTWKAVADIAEGLKSKVTNYMEKYGSEHWMKAKSLALNLYTYAKDYMSKALHSERTQKFISSVNEVSAHAQRQISLVFNELEKLLESLLARYPSLVPMARRPYTGWLVYFLCMLPFIAVSMPWFGLLQSRKKKAAGTKKTRKSR